MKWKLLIVLGLLIVTGCAVHMLLRIPNASMLEILGSVLLFVGGWVVALVGLCNWIAEGFQSSYE